MSKLKLKFNLVDKFELEENKIKNDIYANFNNIHLEEKHIFYKNNNSVYDEIKYWESIFYKSIYINPYFFSKEYYSIGTHLQLNLDYFKIIKFLKYQPTSHSYFRIYEIFTKFFKNDKINVFCNIKNNIHTENYEFINNIKKYEITADNVYNLIDTTNTDYYKLVIYTYHTTFYKLPYYSFSGEINMFVGMLCGFKYTKIGGHFILAFGMVDSKNRADIYLICKQFFEKSYLYYPEITNPVKHSGSYAIFKYFKGVPESFFNELLEILEKIKKEYPDPKDLNIYEKEIRDKYFITKPIDKVRKYISGFLDTDLNKPSDFKLYDEIIEHNNKRYLKQYQFMKKLQKILYIPIENLPIVPTNEQINESILYCKKWDIEYNETFKKPLIQKKMIKSILYDIYNQIIPFEFKFKKNGTKFYISTKIDKSERSSLLNEYKNKIKKNIKYIQFKSIEEVIKKYDLDQLSSKYNTYITDNENIQIDDNLIQKIDKINYELDKAMLNIKSLYNQLKLDFKIHNYNLNSSIQYDIVRFNLDLFKSNYKLSRKIKKTKKHSSKKHSSKKKSSKKYEDLKESKSISEFTLKNPNSNIIKSIKNNITNSFINLEWVVLYDMLYNLDIIPKKCISEKKINIVHLSDLKMANSEKNAINTYLDSKFTINTFFQKDKILKPIDIENIKNKLDNNIDFFIYNIESDKFLNEKGTIKSYESEKIKMIFAIINGLVMLSKDGSMLIKLSLPIKEPILLNLIYICYNYFENITFYKPEQFFGDDYFYLVCKGYNNISEELLISLFDIIDFSSYKKFSEYKKDILKLDIIQNKYSKSFVYQLLYGYELLINKSIFRLDKEYFYINNINYISSEFNILRTKYIEFKKKEWLKKYNFL